MDSLHEHLEALGVRVHRWSDALDTPVLKGPATDADEVELSHVIDRGSQRPAFLKTSIGSVAALLQPEFTEAQAAHLVDRLKHNGVLDVVESKVGMGCQTSKEAT